MPATRYGIDLQEIYNNKANLDGKRTSNQLNALQLSEAERMVRERPAKEAEAMKRQNELTYLRGGAASGNENAAQRLLQLDPEGAPEFLKAVSEMDERKREAAKKSVDEMGKLSHYVLSGKTPEERAGRYKTLLAGVSPDVKAKLPAEYDEDFMNMSLSKAMTMDDILSNPDVKQFGSNDQMYKNGLIVGQTTHEYKPTGGGTTGSGEIKAADESLMFRQAGELLGGVFDQAGNLTNLDPETRNKVQAIATLASQMWKGGQLTRTEAVAEAAKKYGFNITNPPVANPADPANIRNLLLPE